SNNQGFASRGLQGLDGLQSGKLEAPAGGFIETDLEIAIQATTRTVAALGQKLADGGDDCFQLTLLVGTGIGQVPAEHQLELVQPTGKISKVTVRRLDGSKLSIQLEAVAGSDLPRLLTRGLLPCGGRRHPGIARRALDLGTVSALGLNLSNQRQLGIDFHRLTA